MLRKVGKLDKIQKNNKVDSTFTVLSTEEQKKRILKELDGTEEGRQKAVELLEISNICDNAFRLRVMFTDTIWTTKEEKRIAEETDKQERHQKYLNKSAYDKQKIQEIQDKKEIFRMYSDKYIELSHKKDKTMSEIEEMYKYFDLMYQNASEDEV